MNPPSLADALSAVPAARGLLDALGGPVGVLGRFVGFGQEELEAGVPGWAWFLMGAACGGTAVWMTRRRIERLMLGERQ